MKKILLFTSLIAVLLGNGCSKTEKYTGEWRDLCKANLAQIDTAKMQWALENKKKPTDTPNESDLRTFLKLSIPEMKCPAGGVYLMNKVDAPTECSVASHNH